MTVANPKPTQSHGEEVHHDVVVDSPRQRRLILAAMCVALVAVVASVSGLNVAQQALAEDIGATQSQLLWVINGYTLALAALLMPVGAIGDRWGMTFSLTYLGRVLQSSGDYAAAQKHFAESLAICQELGDQRGAAFALQNLGDTAFARGDLATASQRYQASLAIYHAIGNRAEQSLTLARLGETYRAGGELDQARQALLDALALAWALPSTPGLLAALLGLAALDLTVGQPAQATPLLHYVYQHPTSTPQQRQQAAQLLASAGADSDEPLAADDEALTRYVERVLSQLQAPASLDL